MEGRAYLLRPDTPKEGKERAPRPGETPDALSGPVGTQAGESGLTMRPPKITPNTLYSLEATEYAQQHGKFIEYHHEAYKAYWADGEDLGDIEVLGRIATAVDLDAAELMEHVKTGVYSETVMDQSQQALQYGIRGIPTFVVGNLLFTGAQPYDVFKSAIEKILTQEPETRDTA